MPPSQSSAQVPLLSKLAPIILLSGSLICCALLFFLPKPWDPAMMIRSLEIQPSALTDHVGKFGWIFTALNALLLALLAITNPRWSTPIYYIENSEAADSQLVKKTPRALYLLCILSIAASAWIAYPRLQHSLWGDEDYTYRHHLNGHFTRDFTKEGHEDGRPFYQILSWYKSIYGYKTTNNHFLYTILGRTSLRAWQLANDKPVWEMNETALRIVPYIFGLLSIAAWLLFYYHIGMPFFSLAWVAALLPIHPWFIRYISEARGYALFFFFLPLWLLCLHQVLKKNNLKKAYWWLGYFLSQFLILYSWVGSACIIVLGNLLLPLFLWRKSIAEQKKTNNNPSSKNRFRFLTPWFVGNLICASCLLALITPCIPQVLDYLRNDQLSQSMGKSWLKNLQSFMSFGMDSRNAYSSPQENSLYVSLTRVALQKGMLVYYLLWGLTVTAFLGVFIFCKKIKYGWLYCLLLLAPALFLYFSSSLREKYVFPWYFNYLVPFCVAMVGISISAIGSLLKKALKYSNATHWTIGILSFAALWAGYAYCSIDKLRVLREYSIDPLRESVLFHRASINHEAAGQRSMITAHIHYGAYCYDAHAFVITEPFSEEINRPGMTRLMRIADTHSVPLYVNIGFLKDARRLMPELINLVEDQSIFEHQETIWGQAPQFDRNLYRYRGGLFDALKTPTATQ